MNQSVLLDMGIDVCQKWDKLSSECFAHIVCIVHKIYKIIQ